MIRKNTFIILAALIFMLMLSACSQEKEVVKLYNWGDYVDESIFDEFEEETGIKVLMDTFETNEDMYIKLKKTGTDYDLAIPSDYMIEKMIKEDMLQKIDMSVLENYSKIDSRFKKMDFDPNEEYSVPYAWGTVGIAYNKKMVDDTVDSWDILWNEKYKDNIFMLNSQRDSIGISLIRLGYSLNSRNVDELEQAKEELIKQKPIVAAYTGDDTKDAMVAEEGAMALTWSGEAQAMALENPDIDYAIPKEGSNIWLDSIVLLKTSKNTENAMKFIDFLCRPDISAKNLGYIAYSTPIPEAVEMLPDELKNSHICNPDMSTFPNMEVFHDPQDIIKEYERIWLEITSAE